MGDTKRSRLEHIESQLERVTSNLKPQHLLKEDNGRPTLRFGYGGWGQLKDPGGSDAVYTLNFRGINYQLEHTIPVTHAAASQMHALMQGQAYNAQAFSHSIAAAHTDLLAALEGAGRLDKILPGAADIHIEEHEPVGGANASAVIARELGHVLFPEEGANAALRTAESISQNIDSSLVMKSYGEHEPQSILMRVYETYFDVRGSSVSGQNVTCILFDDDGKKWSIRDLNTDNFMVDVVLNATAFAEGVMPHFSNKMASPLAQDWQASMIKQSENHELCPETTLSPAELATLGLDPSYVQPRQMILWDHMLRDVQENLIIPPANELLKEYGSSETRLDVNARPTPFADIFAQLGYEDMAIATAVRDDLMLTVYGNRIDTRRIIDSDSRPSFEVKARALEDGGWILQIEDINHTEAGERVLSHLLQDSPETTTISVDRLGEANSNTRLSKLSISASSTEELGSFLDKKLQHRGTEVSDDLNQIKVHLRDTAPEISSSHGPNV